MESRNKEIISENEAFEELNNFESATENNEPVAFSDENTKKPPLWKRFIKSRFFSRPMKILIWVFLFSIIVYTLSRISPDFAEFWTKFPAQAIRFVLAKVTGWIPFSLAEMLLLSIPVLAIWYIVASNVSTRRDESDENFYKWTRPLVSVFLIIFILLFTAFAPAYGRFKLAKNLGLEEKPVTSDDLYTTSIEIADIAKGDLESISFDKDGASIMPYDYHTLVDKMNAAFGKYAAEAHYIAHFSSEPKPIAMSKPMLYTHISGIYTFMTGESNINTEYPDFLIPFTMAHEMAHQRGIAREDEANFVAFLVCIGSDDEYIRYSGYANMLNYLCNALAKADSSKFSSFAREQMPDEILDELIAYSLFFDKYRDSVVSDITGTINDVFLQTQGQSAGIRSYGLVVDLAVAYYKN